MEKDTKAIFPGKKISDIRESKGLSIRKLSKLIGISDTALSKIETGKTISITIDLGKSIAKALEISFNELFDIELPKNDGIEEALKMEIDRLTKLNKDQKELIDLRSELVKSYERSFVMIYQQSSIIINDIIYSTINEFKDIYKNSDSNISENTYQELGNKIMEQTRSKYIDFFTVMYKKMAE